MTGLDFFLRIFDAAAPLKVIDAGAHVGESVQSFLDHFPQARIHAFEPAPDNFSRLRTRFEGHPGVTAVAAAVGPISGRATMHLNNHDATHSLMPIDRSEISRWADTDDIREVGTVSVAQIALDDFLVQEGIRHVDVLKLDLQGGELGALQGARSALVAQRIGCIFAEVEFRSLYQDQPLAWDIHALLAAHGYHFINFISPKVTDAGLLSWADAIYVAESAWSKLRSRHVAGRLQPATRPTP